MIVLGGKAVNKRRRLPTGGWAESNPSKHDILKEVRLLHLANVPNDDLTDGTRLRHRPQATGHKPRVTGHEPRDFHILV